VKHIVQPITRTCDVPFMIGNRNSLECSHFSSDDIVILNVQFLMNTG